MHHGADFRKFKVSNTAALWMQTTHKLIHPAQIINVNVYCNFHLLTETPVESLQSKLLSLSRSKTSLLHAGWVSQRARRRAKEKFQNTQDAVPSNLLISIADHQFKHPQQPLSPKPPSVRHQQHRLYTVSNYLRVRREGLIPPLASV